MKNFKAIYRILKTLENYMGREDFDVYYISADKCKMPYEKWEQLLILLADAGYIKGIVATKTLRDHFRHIAEPIQPEITMAGLEFLEDNSFMAKAKELLKMVGEII